MSLMFVTDLAKALGFGQGMRLAKELDIRLRHDVPVVEVVAKEVMDDVTVSDVADMIRERHYQLVRWISVVEQLPPSDEDVIIWDRITYTERVARVRGGNLLYDIGDPDGWLEFSQPDGNGFFLASYWMPRLQPPKLHGVKK